MMLAPENEAVADPVPPLAKASIPEDTFEALRLVIFAPLKAAVADPVPPDATGNMAELGTSIVVPLTITALPDG